MQRTQSSEPQEVRQPAVRSESEMAVRCRNCPVAGLLVLLRQTYRRSRYAMFRRLASQPCRHDGSALRWCMCWHAKHDGIYACLVWIALQNNGLDSANA